MLKILHPNRWFFWAISIIAIVFVFVLGQVKLYAAEVEQENIANLVGSGGPPLGSLAWNKDDKGKTYINYSSISGTKQSHPLSEVTYPTKWILKEGQSRIYFSNRSHQCVLTVSDTEPSVGNFTLVGEKIFTTDRGDIKLNIFRNNDAVNEQKYLVQPAGGVLPKIEGDYVFGLIRVSEPQLCIDTFGKILSTAKFAEEK